MSSEPSDPWDDVAADWDHDDGPRAYASAAFASLLDELARRGATLDGARVLDFGAGTGLLTELMQPTASRIVAVDTSPAMREIFAAKAVDWPTVTVTDRLPDDDHELDIQELDMQAFDVVVCSSVLGFVDDYPATVAQLVGRLTPGGVFVQWDWELTTSEHGAAAEDTHGLSRAEMSTVMAECGLAEVRVDIGFVVKVEGTEMRPLMASGVVAS